MDSKEWINPHQFLILVIITTIGDAILVLPTIVSHVAQQDAWLSTLIGLVLGMLVVLLFITVGNLYPNLSFVQYILKILGKWIGSIVVIFFLIFLFLSVSAHTRELADFITTQILIETPIKVIHFMFITVIIFGVRCGLGTIARTSEVLYPVVFIFLLILFSLVLQDIRLEWIRPILNGGFKPVFSGALVATAFPFMELVVFLMFLPNITKQNKIKKNFLKGALIGGSILVIVVLLCILVLGDATTIRSVYPTFALARSISIGNSIQRIEGIIAILWTITVYIKITLYAYAFHIGLVQLLNLKEYRLFTFPFGFILFASTTLVAPNVSYFNDVISKYWSFYDFTIAVFLPLLLICVYSIRKKFDSPSLET